MLAACLLLCTDCTGLSIRTPAASSRRARGTALSFRMQQPATLETSQAEVPLRAEAAVEVRDAGAKGMGAYSGERLSAGQWVGTYVGTL